MPAVATLAEAHFRYGRRGTFPVLATKAERASLIAVTTAARRNPYSLTDIIDAGQAELAELRQAATASQAMC